MSLTYSSFVSPRWLPGGHVQTVVPLTRRGEVPHYRRERIATPDGDFLDLDWLATEASADAPLVVLFHGLEGSSRSHYARSLMRALDAYRWRGVVVHFRGCSGAPNRLARAYHSGDSAEIDWILLRLSALAGHAPLFAVGVSLGGNALLKWLGEQAHAATRCLAGAASVCPPLDLTISGNALGQGLNRFYSMHFLHTLRRKALDKHARFQGLFDPERIRCATTLHDFDDAYTAPAHGFTGVADYWTRASSKPWLRAIQVPTLLLCAHNDPFVPLGALPTAHEISSAIHFECANGGGHVGFMSGPWPGHIDWLPNRLINYFDKLQRIAG